jgi:glucoamylase
MKMELPITTLFLDNLKDQTVSPRLIWQFNHKLRSVPPGEMLRIELLAPACIHWSADDWKICHDIRTRDAGLKTHQVDLATDAFPEGKEINFTFYWSDAGHWEGKDFTVRIASWRRDYVGPSEKRGANEYHD